MTNRLELSWNLDGFIDEQRYYCAETSIDPENLPTPKVILAGDVRTYVDTDIEADKTYFVAIGSVKNNVEKLSDQVKILALNDLILSLFNTNLGYYFNPNYTETLWQDVAGIVPATVGSIVRRIDNLCKLSGAPAYAYATSDQKSPILRQDAKGYYLDFSGGQSFVIDQVNINSMSASFFYKYSPNNVVQTSIVFETSSNAYNSQNNPYAILSLIDSSSVASYGSGNLTATDSMITSRPITSNIESTVIGIVKQNPVKSAVKVNGGVEGISTVYRGQPQNFRKYNHYWGSRNNGSFYLNGKMRAFGLAFKELTSIEVTDFEQTLSIYS